jgi:hypothetical protein
MRVRVRVITNEVLAGGLVLPLQLQSVVAVLLASSSLALLMLFGSISS